MNAPRGEIVNRSVLLREVASDHTLADFPLSAMGRAGFGHELALDGRSRKRGVASLCIGGGEATAMAIELA